MDLDKLLGEKFARRIEAVDRVEEIAEEVVTELVEAEKYYPPKGAQTAAKRALQWIADGKAGDGFTDTGRARAAQLARGGSVSREVAAKMKAYFARHQVDKKAKGFRSGEDGYPSPGRVAWDAWGGDAAASWSAKLTFDD